MAIYGFDFGTTNSLISLVQGDRAVSLTDVDGGPMPSVVCYEGNRVVFGREARERLDKPGLGVHGNVVRSPKMELRKQTVHVGGVERSTVDIVRDVVTNLREEAQRSYKLDGKKQIDFAVVTIPVNVDGMYRARLRDAFRAAGIGIVRFVHEPLAALYGSLREATDWQAAVRELDGKLLLVFDWGGGTLDLTLCRLQGGVLLQIGNDGTDEIGGDVFDDELRKAVEQKFRLKKAIPEDAQVQPDARARLMHSCEKAKIDLSSRSQVKVYVPNFFEGLVDPDLVLDLTRNELLEIVRPLIGKGLRRIESLIEREGYSRTAVSMCLATGGMTAMPEIQSRLREYFGSERVRTSNLDRSASLVSVGAAWIGHDDAKLCLAKNVELMLARNSFFPLLYAGLQLPEREQTSKEDFTFYCVDPTDGHGKFELVSPDRPGKDVLRGDPRHHLAHFIVDVDAHARPFQERLWLQLVLDDNLILSVHVKAGNGCAEQFLSVHELEFALAFPVGDMPSDKDAAGPGDRLSVDAKAEEGTLVVRSNISDHVDWGLVPGEVVRRVDPQRLDLRRSPPQIQIDEDLYYQPCAVCGLPSNHPNCHCASGGEARTGAS